MFSQRVLRGVATGEVTVAFRRWSSPQARPHTQVRTPVGMVGIGEVRQVDAAGITEEEAHQAGFRSSQALRSSLDKHGGGRVYRVELRWLGPVPEEPSEEVVLQARERAEIDRSLARWDVSSPRGPWTRGLLELVRDRPGVRAAELAAEQNRPVSRLKSDVWKLKQLGLTENAESGYRLSPRGQAYLA